MSNFKIRNLALVLAMCATSAVSAAPVGYTFSTSTGPTGASHIVALLGSDARVTGSFIYNNGAAYIGEAGDTGFDSGLSVYGGATADEASFYRIKGEVAGRSFSDIVGAVSVGNNAAGFGGQDFLTLISDVPPRVGASTTPSDIDRQLIGFTIGDYTLHNMRVMWIQPGQPGFLSSNAMPAALPPLPYSVALDFIRTDDPTNTAGVPYYSNTVFFNGMTMQAAPVPEPASLALALAGVTALALARRRRAM